MIDRRTFVAAMGLGAAGAALGAQPAGEERLRSLRGRRRGGASRVKLAVKLGMIGAGETVAEKFAIAREAGFDGVEPSSPNDLDTEEVLRAKEETGIEIPGVVDSAHWSKPLSDPDPAVRTAGRHALERALLDCRDYGGTAVLLVPAVVKAGVGYADAYSRSQREIGRALALADELNVSIAIENVWNNFLLSPLEARKYVDELGGLGGDGRRFRMIYGSDPDEPGLRRAFQRLVGWYLDLGNIVNYGWPEHWIRTLGERIVRLDVKDFSRAKRDEQGLWKGFDVAIGEGDVDWAAVRAALGEVGYEGWASAEVSGGGPERLADVARRMERVLNEGRE